MGDSKRKPVGHTLDGRTRNWCFLAYDEWCQPGWEAKLNELHVPWCHSPLHDRDLNPDTGELKKPHYHCVILFDGSKSQDQIHDLLRVYLNEKAPLPIPCLTVRGSVRYFCHLDDKDKAVYDPAKCYYYGCDPQSLVLPSSSEKAQFLREMQFWIKDNDITEFCDLYDYASENEADWFHLLNTSCAIVMNTYLRSRRFKAKGR